VTLPVCIEVEGRLRFTFQRPAWEAVKWDEDPAYVRGLQEHDGKAVDIVATLDRRSLHLFEVKDPRGDVVPYRDRVPDETLAQIVADKVRDTIAGLVYARDRHPGDHLSLHLQTLFVGRTERIMVILWLETPDLDPPRAATLAGLIERKLRWLKPNVLVSRRALWPGIPGLDIESMHGAPWSG
jgi:hypothetical protein